MTTHMGAAGDRVAGALGLGTVVGASANPLLRGVAVSVRWDDGYMLDERLSTLRKAPANRGTLEAAGLHRPQVGAQMPSLAIPALKSGGVPYPAQVSVLAPKPNMYPPSLWTTGGYVVPMTAVGNRVVPSGGHTTAIMPAVGVYGGIGGLSGHQPSVWTSAHPTVPEVWPASETKPLPRYVMASAFRPRSRLGLEDARENPLKGFRSLTHDSSTAERSPARPRLNSQVNFADRSQTVIFFDWDDTLFPTTLLLDDFALDWRLPMSLQVILSPSVRQEVQRKLAVCEDKALETLRRAYLRGQVVILTLAKTGWVDRACRQFYPRVGELLSQFSIPTVYAMDKDQRTDIPALRARCRSDEEFYGLLKGRAISEELERCYSQYEGQTWKNVLSIGDSRFERYGLLAASTAYISGRNMSCFDAVPQSPEKRSAWEKVDAESVVRLRVKCCKLVERPDMDELATELDMLVNWLDLMVKLDEGFDLDIEALKDSSQFTLVEQVMRGERPVSHLPKRD